MHKLKPFDLYHIEGSSMQGATLPPSRVSNTLCAVHVPWHLTCEVTIDSVVR